MPYRGGFTHKKGVKLTDSLIFDESCQKSYSIVVLCIYIPNTIYIVYLDSLLLAWVAQKSTENA